MKNRFHNALCLVALAATIFGSTAHACSWAVFAKNAFALVVRTMDWYVDDNAVAKGYGRGVREKAGASETALEYEVKYANIRIHSFEMTPTIEALNEKGLQGSILYLEGSRLPEPIEGRDEINPFYFVNYAVSSFATVAEVVASLGRINFISPPFSIPGPGGAPLEMEAGLFPLHFAFSDISGDKAIIEFVDGNLKVYHGPEHNAMTNEPPYDVHREVLAQGYPAFATIRTIDRWLKAKYYLMDMEDRGVETHGRALLAMRGLLASVNAGTEEIDHSMDEVYPTIWGVVTDLGNARYYMNRYNTWCTEIYDFTMFDKTQAAVTVLKAAECPYGAFDPEE